VSATDQLPQLPVEARPTGAGWWPWRFWRDGREGVLRLDTYPEVSLEGARERRDEERRALAGGPDPSENRQANKTARIAAEVSSIASTS